MGEDKTHAARYVAAHIDDITTIPYEWAPTTEWKPLRRFFGIGSFGTNLFRAPAPGDVLTEDHTEDSIRAPVTRNGGRHRPSRKQERPLESVRRFHHQHGGGAAGDADHGSRDRRGGDRAFPGHGSAKRAEVLCGERGDLFGLAANSAFQRVPERGRGGPSERSSMAPSGSSKTSTCSARSSYSRRAPPR